MVGASNIAVLAEMNRHVLGQLRAVLQEIGQKQFTVVNAKGNASIGQHVRHTLEFYLCLLDASENVNYDLRKRDVLIESSAGHAVSILNSILLRIESLQEDRPLRLVTVVSSDGPVAIEMGSTFERELFYVLEHAIHHMALIRVLVKDMDNAFPLPENFGVAYSTLIHRQLEANGHS
jgi:uncharacterized damage-inducible protein DinB